MAFLIIAAGCVMQACSDSSTKTESSSTDSSTNMTSDTQSNQSNMGADTGKMNGGPSGMATDTSSSRTSSGQKPDKATTDFIMKAASGGMMEVELGQAAQQNAQNQRVKDFGAMMVTDHTNANNELKTIASSKSVDVPATLMPDHQKHVDMLKNKTGAEFDKAYMKMMLDDHKKDIGEFKKASTGSTDADIKTFAGKTLPTLQKHLDSAQAINKGKM